MSVDPPSSEVVAASLARMPSAVRLPCFSGSLCCWCRRRCDSCGGLRRIQKQAKTPQPRRTAAIERLIEEPRMTVWLECFETLGTGAAVGLEGYGAGELVKEADRDETAAVVSVPIGERSVCDPDMVC